MEEVKELCKNKEIITDDKLESLLGGKSYQKTNADLGKILAKLALEKSKNSDCNWRKVKPLYIQPPPMG